MTLGSKRTIFSVEQYLFFVLRILYWCKSRVLSSCNLPLLAHNVHNRYDSEAWCYLLSLYWRSRAESKSRNQPELAWIVLSCYYPSSWCSTTQERLYTLLCRDENFSLVTQHSFKPLQWSSDRDVKTADKVQNRKRTMFMFLVKTG